jgi:hypothetical protein
MAVRSSYLGLLANQKIHDVLARLIARIYELCIDLTNPDG